MNKHLTDSDTSSQDSAWSVTEARPHEGPHKKAKADHDRRNAASGAHSWPAYGRAVDDSAHHAHGAEPALCPSPDYFSTTQQHGLTPMMRLILVDWLVDVSDHWRLGGETLFGAVSLLDRFLSRERVPRDDLQLAGLACLWAAAKFQEEKRRVPRARDCCAMTDDTYTVGQLLAMELRVLGAVSFRVGTAPTPKAHLRRLADACGADEPTYYLSCFLAELAVSDAACALSLAPAALAAAALFLAGCMGGADASPWGATARRVGRKGLGALSGAVRLVAAAHRGVLEGGFTASLEKYSRSSWLGVGGAQPLSEARVEALIAEWGDEA